ncbi:hypothetical protein GCM10020229_10360 [Kitasatospora albolonga]|uniref:hypothetical protein n=1 Tax=Kitasatospora albolonga TaxID=68173 RepID=UPI0031E58E7A
MGRQKPGKPRRRSGRDPHRHPGIVVNDGPHPDGWNTDAALLETVTGAALARCTSCQDVTLTLLVEDPVTCARLVELACEAIIERQGSLPRNQTDPDAPGFASLAFRRLARAGQGATTRGMYQECEQMTGEERRAAANTALDTLVGFASLPPGLIDQLKRAAVDAAKRRNP